MSLLDDFARDTVNFPTILMDWNENFLIVKISILLSCVIYPIHSNINHRQRVFYNRNILGTAAELLKKNLFYLEFPLNQVIMRRGTKTFQYLIFNIEFFSRFFSTLTWMG